jgi:hypothetical protein
MAAKPIIPPDGRGRTKGARSHVATAIEGLGVGECALFVLWKECRLASAAASYYGKTRGRKYVCRNTANGLGVWRLE